MLTEAEIRAWARARMHSKAMMLLGLDRGGLEEEMRYYKLALQEQEVRP